jgi:hypothetical protein
MKEEFHARFVVILQILYKKERLIYFSNRITITFDLTNMGRPANWCSIVLTQLLVKLTRWTECQKKVTANPISSKIKANNCYSKPILDILFKKWFPLFAMPSPRIETLKELVSPTSQKC